MKTGKSYTLTGATLMEALRKEGLENVPCIEIMDLIRLTPKGQG
jgi:hypothetical protein